MHPLPKHIGPYTIQRELGRGGMGVVYKALDPSLGRLVAIKVLPEEWAGDPERLARLEREARILASLNHPQIEILYALGQTPAGVPYLVLEYLEGTTLAARLRSALEPAEALDIAGQIARALAFAHERGIVHRDLKPGNVMLTGASSVKVLDFGIARQIVTPGESDATTAAGGTLTKPGDLLGTPGYMSPEQLLGQKVDARTDVFALGTILFECLAGKPPFVGSGSDNPIAAILTRPPDWSLLPPALPETVRLLLESSLEVEVAKRLPGMMEFAARLDRLGKSASAQPSGRQPIPEHTRRQGTGSLPRPLSSFVGRERELDECERLLCSTRTLTLTGPGGSGKTRLALALAERTLALRARAVWFVDLAALTDGSRVVATVAASLGLRDEGSAASERIVEHLSGRESLLLLDNCEHVLATTAALACTLMAGCPGLQILATSRQSLEIEGEQTFPVPPLEVPAVDEHRVERIAAAESVRLFAARACLIDPSFTPGALVAPVVGDICRQLDGIPLAIELAAARVRVMSVQDIRDRLGDRFRLLTGGARETVPRQRTLLATVQWSYDLLSPAEQSLFRALGTFSGGWTLEAAAEICAGDPPEFDVMEQLDGLVGKSLVEVDRREGARARYRFLESVRQFAVERLAESGQAERLRERHFAWFLRLAERGGPAVIGPEQAIWLSRFEEDHENLLSALDWGCQSVGAGERAVRLASLLWRFWYAHGHLAVGREILARVLALENAQAPSTERCTAVAGAALLAYWQADHAAARALYEESLQIARGLHDFEAIGRALNGLGAVAGAGANLEAARRYFEGSLAAFQQTGQKHGTAVALQNLSEVAFWQRDLLMAWTLADSGLALRRELGDEQGIARALATLALIVLHRRDATKAREHLSESIRLVRKQGHLGIGVMAIEVAAEMAVQDDDPVLAARLLGTAENVRSTLRLPPSAMERGALEELRTGLRSRLGESAFETAHSAGREASLDQSLEHVLEWLQSRKPAGA